MISYSQILHYFLLASRIKVVRLFSNYKAQIFNFCTNCDPNCWSKVTFIAMFTFGLFSKSLLAEWKHWQNELRCLDGSLEKSSAGSFIGIQDKVSNQFMYFGIKEWFCGVTLQAEFVFKYCWDSLLRWAPVLLLRGFSIQEAMNQPIYVAQPRDPFAPQTFPGKNWKPKLGLRFRVDQKSHECFSKTQPYLKSPLVHRSYESMRWIVPSQPQMRVVSSKRIVKSPATS